MSIVPFLVIAVLTGIFGMVCYWVGWIEGWLTAKQEEHGKRKGKS